MSKPINTEHPASRRIVNALIERDKRGEAMTLGEVARICPFRTLLALGPVTPESRPTAVQVVLGFEPEDINDDMREFIMAEIQRGGVVMLISNSRELRDYAKREITLLLTNARGAA